MNYSNTSLISRRFSNSPSFLSSAEISVLHPSKDAAANNSASSSKDRGAHNSVHPSEADAARSSGSPLKNSAAAAHDDASSLEAKQRDIDRLEEAYARLETQFLRAEENCQLVRKKNKDAEDPNLKEIMKADAFAHRVLLQQIRILRDLRLAHKNLERTAKDLETFASPTDPPNAASADASPWAPPSSQFAAPNAPSNDAQIAVANAKDTAPSLSPTSLSDDDLDHAVPAAKQSPSSTSTTQPNCGPDPTQNPADKSRAA
jgi:hypothetical protein